jgi:hypothetical protein
MSLSDIALVVVLGMVLIPISVMAVMTEFRGGP